MTRPTELRVLWTEGLLLGPAHLQQETRHLRSQLNARLAALHPHDWGAVRLEIDRVALAQGQVKLTAFAGVMPDGTALAIEGGEHPEAPPSRPVEGLDRDRAMLEVYLGVTRERDGVREVGERARYRALRRRGYDVFSDESSASATEAQAVELDLAALQTRLYFGHEAREDADCIKLAEVRRDSEGAFVLDETFVPPALRLGASSALASALARLLDRIDVRRRALLSARRERDAGTIEVDATDVGRFVLLSALCRHYPVLRHLASAREVSPHALYLALLELAGELSAFSIDASLDLPSYEHTDLRGTFTPLFGRIERLLSDSHRESSFAIDLTAREDGMHLGELDDRAARCDRFLIAVRTEVAAKQAMTLVPAIAKLASWSQISHVLGAALPGAKLTIEHRPPPEVPIRAGDLYFTIESRGSYWSDVIAQRNVALFLPRPFDPAGTKVQLIAIPARSGASNGARPAPPIPRT